MVKIEYLSCDLETFSSVNLQKSGVFPYCQSDDFEILLFAYSINGEEVKIVDLTQGESIPAEILEVLQDDAIVKWAYNAAFERICLSRYLGLPDGKYLNPKSWRCSMIWAATLGLPFSLAGVGRVLGLEEQKLSKGKDLIKYFCVPCIPTKVNNQRTRNLPRHDLEKWEQFKTYNIRDVEVEMNIQMKLAKYPVLDFVWEEYILDQEINDRGILIDEEFVQQAILLHETSREEIYDQLIQLTGLENPNSVVQIRGWLNGFGVQVDSLDKKAVNELLTTVQEPLQTVLKLRQQLAKSSVKKYEAMQNYTGADNRARGLFQFYGGNRTGRFAGRGIQMQNLPQNHMEDLSEARALVKQGNLEGLNILYDSIPNVLSELIRTAIIAKENKKFIVADFSAIEARVIAWLADETWRNEVFTTHGKIYEASAAQMFHVPIQEITKSSPLRQKGKIAELALGYGGSVGALKAMGATSMGVDEDELKPLVNSWRKENPNIVNLWWEVDKAVLKAVKMKTTTRTHGIVFSCKSGMLFIVLPSGRKLAYVKPRLGENQFGGECVTYEGVGTAKRWERIQSYGPKFVENIVQGIARDILCFAMKNLSRYDIVGHIHDEIIFEVDREIQVESICQEMSQTPSWAEGMLLNADGYECQFYKKE